MKIFRKNEEKQFVPTKEDLENKELKLLAKRLESKSPKKTLTNILEWQDRNLKYWEERWLTATIMVFLLFLSAFTLYQYFNAINPAVLGLLILGIVSLIFLGTSLFKFVYYLVFLLIFIIIYVVIITSSLQSITVNSKTFLFIIAISLLLGAFLSLIISLIMKYKNIKSTVPDFKIEDTFKLSLPVEKILKYRLSICRDYAKLTSALLLALYNKEEIYFTLIPKHVAVAIKLNEKLYVLDQKLPILTLEKWVDKWKKKLKKKKLDVKLIKVSKVDEEIKTEKIKEKFRIENNSSPNRNLNIQEMTKELKKLLRVNNRSQNNAGNIEVEIPLKKATNLFENDKIAIFSLIEAIKNKVEDELAGNIRNIYDLTLRQTGEDLILKINLIKK